jgi:hypothetical protein
VEYPLIIVLALTMSTKEADFESFAKSREEAFVEWQERNSGDFKAYLDSKVLEFTEPKDVKALKKQVYLLALYKKKSEPPSRVLLDYAKKYEDDLRNLDVSKLTWEELLSKIQSRNAKSDSANKED